MFQSNSLSREYLYLDTLAAVLVPVIVSIQLPIKGVFIHNQGTGVSLLILVSIQLPIKGVFILSVPIPNFNNTSFNPTPYQGSIYTTTEDKNRLLNQVSIQLPIKGVFIDKDVNHATNS